MELASKNESIPAPSILGICNSATEISTLGNPPTTVEVDCKDNKPVKLPNIPSTPSTPLNAARPINPITPKITMDIKSFWCTNQAALLGYNSLSLSPMLNT